MDKYDPEKKITLVVDEWGAWHAPLPGSNPGFLVQQNSVRDAVLAALNLNIFARHADRVRMANIAQMINVLQAMILTDKEKMVLTPTYYVFKMYVPFQDATFIPVDLRRGYLHPWRRNPAALRRHRGERALTASCCLRSPTSTRKTRRPSKQTWPASPQNRPAAETLTGAAGRQHQHLRIPQYSCAEADSGKSSERQTVAHGSTTIRDGGFNRAVAAGARRCTDALPR